MKKQGKKFQIDHILSVVLTELDIPMERMRTKEKTRPLADARKIYFMLCNQYGVYLAMKKVAGKIKKSHSSMITGIREGNILVQTDPVFKQKHFICETRLLSQSDLAI